MSIFQNKGKRKDELNIEKVEKKKKREAEKEAQNIVNIRLYILGQTKIFLFLWYIMKNV